MQAASRKTHFRSDEIAHIWAHKSAPRGEAPGAMSFDGDSFRSYGTVIGRHITHKGMEAVLVNETSYSVTTAKHLGIMRRAIAGMHIFRIGGIDRGSSLRDVSGADIFEYAISEADKAQQRATKARTHKDYLLSRAAGWLERAKAANEFFGLRRKCDDQAIARLQASKERAEREQKRKAAARDLAARLEQQAAYEAWKQGEQDGYFNVSLFPVAFRVEADELVSSLGARVPIHEARVAFRFIQSRKSGWQRNGETCPVGHYQLDTINAEGVKAGCHRITWEEITRLSSIFA